MVNCSHEISRAEGQLTQKFNGDGHTDSARLPHRPIISLMKDQLDYRNSENSLFYQACSCKAKSALHSSKWYMLSSAILKEIQFISIQQIPWRTSNACIT